MKYIAISFDDGPCPTFNYGGTSALLDVLKELGIKATFFVIGQNMRGNEELSSAIFRAGHELENHSDNYFPIAKAGKAEIEKSLKITNEEIIKITGKPAKFFRAPYSEHSQDLCDVCKMFGLPLIDGSIHNDYPGDGPTILSSILNNPQDGDILVLHENNTSRGNTMAVMPQVASGLREQGFEIVTIGQLAALKNKKLEPGVRYAKL